MIDEWKGEDLEMLAQVLYACVNGGASVSFLLPFSVEESRSFWQDKVLPSVRRGERRVLVARSNGEIVGTVQLLLDTPPNQRHRADVAKMLVHPKARRQGIARALMLAVEELAKAEGRTLLTLDTVTGGAAEPLYLALGYTLVGVIPRYALNPSGTVLESTSIMYKKI